MDPFLIFVAVAGGFAVVQRLRRRKQAELWAQTASACGLTDIEVHSNRTFGRWVTARQGLLRVRIEGSLEAVHVRVGGVANVTLRPRSEWTDAARGDKRIGDPAFDEAVIAQGPEAVLRGLLDEDTRRSVRDLFVGRLGPRTLRVKAAIAQGEITAVFDDRWRGGSAPEPRPDSLRALIRLAVRLTTPSRPLFHIARDDPEADVRAGALRLLALGDSHGEPIGGAISRERLHGLMESALVDGDPEVRLQAAMWLGSAGQEELETLANSTSASDDTSASAITALGDRLELAPARTILSHALRHDRPQTARAAILALAKHGPAAVDALLPVLSDSRVDLATLAVRALGRTGSPAAEEALIAAAARNEHPLSQAAAEALEDVGTAASVATLAALERRGQMGTDRAARRALFRVRMRLTGGRPGQLSIAGDADGAVTLADDERGRVSDPEEPAE